MEGTLYKRLGILQHQQSRLQFLWSLRFCYQMGWIFSWTILIALFVSTFGIEHLISFFLVDAGLFLLGSLLSTSLFLRMNLDRFLFCASIGVILGLTGASFLIHDEVLFLGVVLLVKIFFMGRSMWLFIEKMNHSSVRMKLVI